MAAVMLAGSPFVADQAFAAGTLDESTTSAKLQNGAKFVIKTSGSYYSVDEITNTATGTTYATLGAATTLDNAAVFEVSNVATNALGVTFNLKVNGKSVALTAGGTAILAGTDADKIYTTFTTAALTSYTLDAMNLLSVGALSSTTQIAAVGALVSKSLDYDAEELNEFNASSTTFSFPGANLEGNVFNNLTPVTATWGGVQGTYFVTGKAADIDAFKAVQDKDNAAKLSFVYVKNEKYGINTSVDGEGYKIVMINGADFYATSNPAYWENAAFTGIKEADQLNKEGEIELSISPKLGSTPSPYNVTIKSVKASTSDTKTYVTTVSANPNKPTRFASKSNPSLGANSYFAASEFLKAGEVSAYNIYFTSGEKDGTEEYHKYLANISDGTNFSCNALASKYVDLNSPSTQWIVTDFDGKYLLTLSNRLTNETLSLRLAATSTAGVYTIAGGAGASHAISNLASGTTLSGKNIKLIPASLTKYDGTLNLSDDEMAEGVTLAFSGANANIGAQTFYAAVEQLTATTYNTSNLIPSLEASDAVKFNVEKIKDNKKQDVAMNITKYAYIDATGNVITLDAAKADTLIVPAYKFSVEIDGTKYAVKNALQLDATAANASAYIINKTMSGVYTATYYNGPSLNYTVHAQPVNNAVGVNNVIVAGTDKLVAQFDLPTKYFAPEVTGFAYLGINANDNTDYTTLPAVSRHATFENPLGAVSMQVNKNGIIEGILGAEPMTFWLDTADSDQNTPHFYISKGIHNEDGELAEMRNFLVYAPDSMQYFDEASASIKTNYAYYLEGTSDVKAIFRPAALVGVDTLSAEIDDKVVTVVKKATAAGEKAVLKNFQYGICLNDADVEGEYVIYSKENPSKYLYSHNGKLGFGDREKALVVTLGEGDPTANEAIEAESNVQVIGGQGVVTVQGAAGKVITVANILGQTIANQVAASDNVTIAAPAGVVVVAVDGEATKVIVK